MNMLLEEKKHSKHASGRNQAFKEHHILVCILNTITNTKKSKKYCHSQVQYLMGKIYWLRLYTSSHKNSRQTHAMRVRNMCMCVIVSLSHKHACMRKHTAQIVSYKVLQANPSMQATLKMHACKMFVSY